MTPPAPTQDTPAGHADNDLRNLARREGRDHAKIEVLRSRITRMENELAEAHSELKALERARDASGDPCSSVCSYSFVAPGDGGIVECGEARFVPRSLRRQE